MDSKKEVNVGDFVQYVDGSGVVRDEDGIPLRVVALKTNTLRPYVVYDSRNFDWYDQVEKADPLLLELL